MSERLADCVWGAFPDAPARALATAPTVDARLAAVAGGGAGRRAAARQLAVILAAAAAQLGGSSAGGGRGPATGAACDGCGALPGRPAPGAPSPLPHRVCDECRSVRYCSRKCQVAAWRQGHRSVCVAGTGRLV